MNKTQQTPESAARHIARTAQQKIRKTTGMTVNVLLYPNDDAMKTPEQLLHVVAMSLNMGSDCYRLRTRKRDIVELRFIAAMLMRMNFPNVTLQQIAGYFGGQDHSSILSGLTRAQDLIYTGELRFLTKYNAVFKSVNLWLRKEESEYASVSSA